MAVVAKRTVLSLYSDDEDIYSHQVRIVLAEKGVNVEIHQINSAYTQTEELYQRNPYGTVPTLVDRELVLYEARIIMEYLDERFPHPPLLPVYPVARAEFRKMMYRIERDWYTLMRDTQGSNDKKAEKAREQLRDSLVTIAPVFSDKEYFFSEEFSLLDCCVAPLLWRLPQLEVSLPDKIAQPIADYAERVFCRPSFQESLTDTEREWQAA